MKVNDLLQDKIMKNAEHRTAGQFHMTTPGNQTNSDNDYQLGLNQYFDNSLGEPIDKLRNFAKYTPHSALGRFLCRYELFKEVVNIHGAFVECGVHLGGGAMTWAQLSGIFEPINHSRRVIGFDTFDGFVDMHDKDLAGSPDAIQENAYRAPAYDDLQEAIRLFDLGRPLGHIPRVELVAGDANKTIPQYIEDNPHLVVAMLYLDFDVYEPTVTALKHFLPRMPKGAIIAFDELYVKQWPGETLAVMEQIGLRNLRIRRFTHQPQISYAVLE